MLTPRRPDPRTKRGSDRRRATLSLVVGGVIAVLLLAALGVTYVLRSRRPEPQPAISLVPASFAVLAGWREDDPAQGLAAFVRSCDRLARLPADRAFGHDPWSGKVRDWLPFCEAARRVPAGAEPARGFFEHGFLLYKIADRDQDEGLFTGYYEPLLEGDREPSERFHVPLYRMPDDLVSVDLSLFDPDLGGHKITGRVVDGHLVPYFERAEIERGALAGRGLELFWVDDLVEAYFLQIQGSGQVRLRDGSVVRVGYAGQNGHPYRAIGRDLVDIGALPKGGVSLQAIRDWLKANPERAQDVLNRNPSFVFFRALAPVGEAPGPQGAQDVALTPGRSLAVDPRFVPLGAPIWLDTLGPSPEGGQPLRRLVVAQDTGGAIKGPIRGDLFWGAGPEAEFAAGHMQSHGRYYILLPRSLAPPTS